MRQQQDDKSVPYELNRALANFTSANKQCICGSELMVSVNGEGAKRYYCPGSRRFFWEGGNCEDGSMFAAPI